MEEIRAILNKKIEDKKISLCSGEVLTVSQELDKLILSYYAKEKEKLRKLDRFQV